MPEVDVRHTAALSASELRAVRTLLFEVFDDFDDADYDHALGGMHALVWDDDDLVGHGAVVQRRVVQRDRAWRCGYVEGIAVRASHRRQGIARTIMSALDDVVRRAYEVGGLGASDEGAPLYRQLGWQLLTGRSHALTPGGVVATPHEDGSIYLLPVVPVADGGVDPSADLTCDWRDGDVW